MIRTDCYLAIMARMKRQFPDARFEEVYKASGSVLAPSANILVATGIFKKPDGTKNPTDFVLYRRLFREHILSDPRAVAWLRKLKEMAISRDVFLVCLEKDATNCHRTLLKEMMDELNDGSS